MNPSEYNREWFADDLKEGDEAPPLTVENIQRKDFVKYAGASGDFNRIHYDEPFATNQGNRSVFGQGMLTAGWVSHMLTRWIGLKYVRSFKTRFQDRVWPGDTLTITGRVAEKSTTQEGASLRLELNAMNQEDTTVLAGEAVIELPTRPG